MFTITSAYSALSNLLEMERSIEDDDPTTNQVYTNKLSQLYDDILESDYLGKLTLWLKNWVTESGDIREAFNVVCDYCNFNQLFDEVF